MYGLYTPILLFQAYCVYHAYRNNAEQRWYWLILFFPLIGCIIYLVYNINANSNTLEDLKANVKEVVVSNYRLEQLEKAFRFSDNTANKVNLADAYIDVARYKDAIILYESSLQGFMSDDPPLRMKLLGAHYLNGDYDLVVKYGNELESEKSFKNAEERVAFAWALFHTGKLEEAERVFSGMDATFTNYFHRVEYCKFLLKIEKGDSAKKKLTELMTEFDEMQSSEKRLKRNVLREIKELYNSNFPQ